MGTRRNRKEMVIELKSAKLVEELRGMIRILNFDYHGDKSPQMSVSEDCQVSAGDVRTISNDQDVNTDKPSD